MWSRGQRQLRRRLFRQDLVYDSMTKFYESVRNQLLKLGATNPVFRSAIRLQALANGFKLSSSDGQLVLSNGTRRMILPVSHYPEIPYAVHVWDLFFATVTPELRGGNQVLDFSKPGLHRYQKSGVSLWSPGMVEEDSMDAYTASYPPQPGDVVWDVGAHAGATSYFLAQMVGRAGRVYAFEPDVLAYKYLMRNIELHKLENVIPVNKALAGESGTALFSMDGTLGAGLASSVQCVSKQNVRQVQTLSLPDACREYGVPAYVKMDIEGAEVDVIVGAAQFLKHNPIHFAIETEHRVNKEYTSVPITRVLTGIGYKVWSSTSAGQQFTWVLPNAGIS
jgi:FkbM family methyltransferase